MEKHMNGVSDAKVPQIGEALERIQAESGAKPPQARQIRKNLGRDEFLQIMIAQMQNQDPTNPFKAEQMATQMAQFASVEQLTNMNQGLDRMMSRSQAADRLQMAHLLGQEVMIDSRRFFHVENDKNTYAFQLSEAAQSVGLKIYDARGEVVHEEALGPRAAGAAQFTWDGTTKTGLPAKEGEYTVAVEAINERGTLIPLEGQKKVQVRGLSFEGQEPVLMVGDAKKPEKVSFRQVVRVEAPTQETNQAPVQKAVADTVSHVLGEKGFPNGLSGGQP
jgi:flagellar basal-body rod modification protein FlgD